MVTIQFVLDEGNVKKAGYTVARIETYLRAFYAARHATEIAYLTFQRDDENAMCNLGDIFGVMVKRPQFMECFKECVWDVDGTVEDCLKELNKCIKKYGR